MSVKGKRRILAACCPICSQFAGAELHRERCHVTKIIKWVAYRPTYIKFGTAEE